MKANFIGIGAQKCASTWLYDILADHPDVCLSNVKEIDYFSLYYDYGFQWYERNFACDPDASITGEVSPSYFHGVSVPERVFKYNPEAKLIVFLRNPIDRLISNHKHEVRIGHLTGSDISIEFGLSNNPSYVEQGMYATHLERWFEYFPRDQMLVVLYDDLLKNGQDVAVNVYRFLGIDSGHVSRSLTERSNVSYVNRSPQLERLKNGVRGILRKIGLGKLWKLIGSVGLQEAYRKYNRKPSEAVIPPLKQETREMLQAVFEDEIARLERIIDRPLDAWRK